MLTGSLPSLSRHRPHFSRFRASYFRVPFLIFAPSQLSESLEQANDRHKKRIENLLSSFRASVRTTHQEQRGTADRNNCRAVVDNPLVKKVKKTLSSALTINIYFDPCRKEKLYI